MYFTPGFKRREIALGAFFAFHNGGINFDDVMFFHGTNIMNKFIFSKSLHESMIPDIEKIYLRRPVFYELYIALNIDIRVT